MKQLKEREDNNNNRTNTWAFRVFVMQWLGLGDELCIHRLKPATLNLKEMKLPTASRGGVSL